MKPAQPAPRYCRPQAFTTLARELDAIHTTRGLVRCAVAVSMHQLDDADPNAIEEAIATLAADIRQRLRGNQTQALIAHTHTVLFDEARFAGNTEAYYHPDNSYLSRVLETRRGLPITMVLLYKAVLENLGVRVQGINAPGHFLAGVSDRPEVDSTNEPDLLVDPFHGGRVLSREEAFKQIEQAAGQRVPRSDALLHPANHPQWLIRLILNLVNVFEQRGQHEDLAAMLEMRSLVESKR